MYNQCFLNFLAATQSGNYNICNICQQKQYQFFLFILYLKLFCAFHRTLSNSNLRRCYFNLAYNLFTNPFNQQLFLFFQQIQSRILAIFYSRLQRFHFDLTKQFFKLNLIELLKTNILQNILNSAIKL
ncbi:hypothetical protein TTHERM_000484729 (macronuclear) [Tetrahymena thermophila SB210]|uniref:Uncharacterized protein n=1 Tax=Tetrahymena thermophila (strain SB210) TaxID=312017 RepID=W7XC54_TETTS|nr:hypothetical protein TTHERM_000484729 [Tetrahymena thermophila SB210]EWS74083.1 hypothetical protein TTHERM_000484729 [Tetrahymena thermophila SB210]|eukprot:XP_012653416.1 hypothetical protein TTHERM_000484729 [Tetrahymena thermophila SB210]